MSEQPQFLQPPQGLSDPSEQASYTPNEVGRHEPSSLELVVGSEQWQTLLPNLASPTDLLPRDLRAAQLAALGETFLEPSFATRLGDAASFEDLPLARDIPGLGLLEHTRSGESKDCFKLTVGDKKMAVLLMNYTSPLESFIPEDPNLTLVNSSPTRRLWEYSDLRTYLCMATRDGRTIKLQEYGEPESSAGRSKVPGLSWLAGMRAANRRIAAKGREFIDFDKYTDPELRKARHYLRKAGHGMRAVIDIPVVERIG
jgi:hypothetical protein